MVNAHRVVASSYLTSVFIAGTATIVVMAAAAAASTPQLLSGSRILVTGAGRGIGRAMAHICHAQGARVAICARTASDLRETALLAATQKRSSTVQDGLVKEEDNDRFLLLPCDVTNDDQVEAMVQAIVEQWGGLDILINNAGGGQESKNDVSVLTSTEFRSLLDLNVVAVHTVTSAVLRHSQNSLRSIVNVSSRAGKMGLAGNAFYCASKFALEGYSATLAEELRPKQIVVNTISPGMVDTLSFPKSPPQRPGVRTGESVRDALLLLLQQKAVTGHYLHVDELDQVRAKGLPDHAAIRPINELPFDP